jgi:NADP-dependent 3-hydroxy acid dehydrogenase YdfG
MTEGIKDKFVVITGASSGLGEAAAGHLALHEAKLVLGASVSKGCRHSP